MFDQISSDVRAFFEEFERNSDPLDADAISRQFADTFMNADPNGAQPVPKAAFLAALPGREKLFASIGVANLGLSAITETRLDDNYILVDTEWAADPVSSEADPLTLSSAFILRRCEDNALHVVFYLNHQDIMEIVRARADLLPQ